MISVLAYIFVGALAFSEQHVEGLRVGTVRPFTGKPAVNFRHTDVDHDGLPDLVLPGAVYFQREGRFPPANRTAMPAFASMPDIDLWAGRLYCRLPGRLAVYAWRETGWETVITQAFEWPEMDGPPGTNPDAGRLTRFLCDAEGDGVPEILAPAPDGLRLYRRKNDEYVRALTWDVLPELTLAATRDATLWPPGERRISLPVRQMWCRIISHEGEVSVLSENETGANRKVYVRRRYPWTEDGALRGTAPAPQVSRGNPVPAHMQACRLNNDGLLDYAGVKWGVSEASTYPALVHETWASVDGGATFAVRRMPSLQGFRPHCAFVDFDGDGDMDIVNESCTLQTAGPREMLSELLSRAAVDHEIRVYTQTGGAFSQKAGVRVRRTIRLRRPPLRSGPVFERYVNAELVSIVGDYNGDGYRDLAVQTTPGRIAVYIASGYGYPDTPAATLTVPEGARFGAADVNADGRSDVVVHPPKSAGGAAANRTTVFFAGEAAP